MYHHSCHLLFPRFLLFLFPSESAFTFQSNLEMLSQFVLRNCSSSFVTWSNLLCFLPVIHTHTHTHTARWLHPYKGAGYPSESGYAGNWTAHLPQICVCMQPSVMRFLLCHYLGRIRISKGWWCCEMRENSEIKSDSDFFGLLCGDFSSARVWMDLLWMHGGCSAVWMLCALRASLSPRNDVDTQLICNSILKMNWWGFLSTLWGNAVNYCIVKLSKCGYYMNL